MTPQKIEAKKYKVVFERINCIGAASCAIVYEERWQMSLDGKVDLQGSQKKENNEVQELQFEEKELELMQQAAKSCPVNAIHIYDTKTNKKLI